MEKSQYHHGDLKRELIDKGLRLLAREGYEGFSMRRLAALCNVSHAAPYKHFKSKEEVILAIATEVSIHFTDALAVAIGRYPDDARLQVVEMCAQYVRFMVDNPDYFRFVFMMAHGRPIDVSLTEIRLEERQPLAAATKCAENYFRPLHGNGWTRDFLALWSMIQGLTLMLISQTIRVDDPADMARKLVEGYITGPAQ